MRVCECVVHEMLRGARSEERGASDGPTREDEVGYGAARPFCAIRLVGGGRVVWMRCWRESGYSGHTSKKAEVATCSPLESKTFTCNVRFLFALP